MARRTKLNQIVANKGLMSNLLLVSDKDTEVPYKLTQLLKLRSMYADYLYADLNINTVSSQLAIYLDINVIQEDDKEHRDAVRKEFIDALFIPMGRNVTTEDNDNDN
jgi:hypothetical protein